MIALGQKVRCKVSGIEGIATSRCEFLYGCVRVGVQGKAKDGKAPEVQYVDEPQLEVVGKGIAVGEAYRHGPRPAPTRAADPTR
jgi:hypothetical protein